MNTETILSVENVVNRFGSQVIHDGVSFTINRGEVVGIVGGSGSGKPNPIAQPVGQAPQGGPSGPVPVFEFEAKEHLPQLEKNKEKAEEDAKVCGKPWKGKADELV